MPSTALIVIDLQYDFFDSVHHGDTGRMVKAICLPGVKRLLEHARAKNWKIVHAATRHTGEESLPAYLQKRKVNKYCISGTDGARVVLDFKNDQDEIIYKQSYDAFEKTGLAEILQGIKSVVIVGLAADCCVLFTAHSAAIKHEKDVYLPYQAISASAVDSYAASLRSAEKSFAHIIDLEELLKIDEPTDKLVTDIQSYPKMEENAKSWFEKEAGLVSAFLSRNPNAIDGTTNINEVLELFLAERSS